MKLRKLGGFSLMEMMVVLLIVAVVMAASAPLISRKMIRSIDSSNVWAERADFGIAYNMGANPWSVLIGSDLNTFVADRTKRPRLQITSNNANISQIELIGNGGKDPLKIYYANNNVVMANDIPMNGTNYASNTVVIGKDAEAHGDNTVAIGKDANANNLYAVAIGCNAKAYTNAPLEAYDKHSAIAIGHNAQSGNDKGNTTTNATIAIGHASISCKFDSIAVGTGANALENYSTAIGNNAKAKAENSTALGIDAESSAQGGIAIGYGARAKSKASIAIGSGYAITSTPLDPNQEINEGETNEGENANQAWNYTSGSKLAFLKNGFAAISTITTTGTISGTSSEGGEDGDGNTKTDQNDNPYGTNGSESLGGGNSGGSTTTTYSTVSEGEGAIAIGSSTNAKINSVAIGNEAQTTGNTAVAHGYKATAKQGAVSVGPMTNAEKYATALGMSADANKPCSIAIGVMAKANHKNSVAIGPGATTTETQQIVLGTDKTTVYIPGKLLVDKQCSLGRKEGYTYFRISRSGSGSYYGYPTSSDGIDLHFTQVYSSDRRLKNVGEVFKGGLAELKKLELYNYTFKEDKDKTPRVGVMAQDLQKVFPDAVIKGEDGFLRIRLEDMFYAVINAVKELDTRLTALAEEVKSNIDLTAKLQEKVNAQDKQIAELKKQNAEFEKRLAKLEKKEK